VPSSPFKYLAFAVAFALAFPAAALAQGAPKPEGTVDMAKVLARGPLPELSLGDAAGVPVIEYGSLTCSHCAAFNHDTMPAFKIAFIDTGKVYFIFREFARNPLDVGAFVLARCVGDDKALATIDLLFTEQDKWAFVDKPLDALLTAMRPTGLSQDKAMACLKDQTKADALTKMTTDAARDVKVQGTPTFVINGNVYGGGLSEADLTAILKPLVK
jgi:protein-disulfide isomerase